MDIIEIKQIKLNALIGVYDWEKAVRQTLTIDVAYGLPTSFNTSDQLSSTIDYDHIIEHIIQFSEKNTFQLIETLGQQLIDSLFNKFSTPWIKLIIHKPFANTKAKDIIFTLERNNPKIS